MLNCQRDDIEGLIFQIKSDLDNITLNEEGNDLQCENGNHYRKCIVTKSDFKNEENGYYFFHHKNKINKEKKTLLIMKPSDLMLFLKKKMNLMVLMIIVNLEKLFIDFT